MKYLIETDAPLTAVAQITERVDSAIGGQRLIACGPSQRIGVPNKNKRIYNESVFTKNLAEGSDFKKRLAENQVLGELEHPESGKTHLTRVSHLMKNAWIEDLTEDNPYGVPEGKYVMTENEILDTPNGRILKTLFEASVPVGISSRGRGDVRTEGEYDIVEDNYDLEVWDYVNSPSVGEARHMTEAGDPNVPGPQGMTGPPGPPPGGDAPPGGDMSELPELPSGPDVPISSPGSKSSDLSAAQQLVDRYADLMTTDDAANMIEVLIDAAEFVDALGGDSSEDAIKVRAQLLMLVKGIVINLKDKLNIKDKSSPAETAPPSSGGSDDGGSDKGDDKSDKDDGPPKEDKSDDVPPKTDDDNKEESFLEMIEGVIENADNLLEACGMEKDKKSKSQGGFKSKEKGAANAIAAAMAKKKGGLTAFGKRGKTEDEDRSVILFRQMLEAYAVQKTEIKDLKEWKHNMRDAVSREKFEASVQLCASVAEKGKEALKENAFTQKKYEASLAAIKGLQEKLAESTKSEFVWKYIHEHPELADYSAKLLECDTREAVEEKAKELVSVIEAVKKAPGTLMMESFGSIPESNLTDSTKKAIDGDKPVDDVKPQNLAEAMNW